MARRYYRRRYYRRNDPIADLFGLVVVGLIFYSLYLYRYENAKFWLIFFIITGIALIIIAAILLPRLLVYIMHRKPRFESKINSNEVTPAANPPNAISRIEDTQSSEVISNIPDEEKRYVLKDSLLSPTEEKFLVVLKKVVGNRFRIIPQMPLSRIINVRDSSAHYTNYHDFNKIAAKTVDFGLCDENLKPCLVIELDDYTHNRPDRRYRDKFVDEVFHQIGLRIVHIPVASSYDEAKLASLLFPTNTNVIGA